MSKNIFTWDWILPSSVTTQCVDEFVGQHIKLNKINVDKTQKAKLGLFAMLSHSKIGLCSMFWTQRLCYVDYNGPSGARWTAFDSTAGFYCPTSARKSATTTLLLTENSSAGTSSENDSKTNPYPVQVSSFASDLCLDDLVGKNWKSVIFKSGSSRSSYATCCRVIGFASVLWEIILYLLQFCGNVLSK